MNAIIATVEEIECCDMIHIVRFRAHGVSLSMMSLELSDAIMIGSRVRLLIKPSHIAIAKVFSGELSFENQLPCKVHSVENGQLLSSIRLDFFDTSLEAIMIASASSRMQLKAGDEVVALIPASALSIGSVEDV